MNAAGLRKLLELWQTLNVDGICRFTIPSHQAFSILNFFRDTADQNFCATIADAAGVQTNLDALSDAAIDAQLLSLASDFRTQFLIGGLQRDGGGTITGANSFRFYPNLFDSSLKDLVDALDASPFSLTVQYDLALDDELDAALSGDYLLNGIAIGAMIVWVAIAMGSSDQIQSGSLMGLASVLTVLLSTAAGFGICSAYGVPVNPVSPGNPPGAAT